MKLWTKSLAIMFVLLLATVGMASAARGGFGMHHGAYDGYYGNSSSPQVRVSYRVHEAGIGWTHSRHAGQIAGTTGESRALEAIVINANSSYKHNIQYRVYSDGLGWSSWRYAGEMAGTTGEGRAIKDIQIRLTGSLSRMKVFYQTHLSELGWMEWVSNGERGGDGRHNIEAIKIEIDD